jgi:hypothetical protein
VNLIGRIDIFIPSFDETFFFPSNRPDNRQVQEGAAGFCSTLLFNSAG